MPGLFSDLLGTTKAFFKIGGTAGVRLKNNAGDLLVRNTGDTADSAVTASKVNVSGDVVDINSDAAGAAADWKYTLQRPAAGMTAAVVLTLPVDDGTPGQVLKTDGAGVLSWVAAGDTSLADKLDTTSLAFGTASPVAMFTTGTADVVDYITVVIDATFDGAPSASVGISTATSKYLSATDIDLKATAGTVFHVHPGLAAAGAAEALIITYAAGAATVGAARFIVHYASPA